MASSVRQAFSNPNPSSDNQEHKTKKKEEIDLGNGSMVIYMPRFVGSDRAWKWFEYLDKEIPWIRPQIHVFGKSCIQPRDTCYVASEGLSDLKYSGYQPHAYSWDDYPVLKDILAAVHEALPGSKFNSLLLNRYKSGSDYVAWHSDDEKLYGPTPEIASVSFGCEREFQLRKRTPKTTPAKEGAKESGAKRQKKSHPDQRSFILKHGSLIVMKGYTQRDWVHSIPKRAKASSVRINLTFRQVMR